MDDIWRVLCLRINSVIVFLNNDKHIPFISNFLNKMYYASLKITSTLPSFNEILKSNYCNQVLWREFRLSPRCKCTCFLLEFDSMSNISSVPTFRNNLSVQSSRVKQSKKNVCFTFGDGADRLTRDVGMELPFNAAWYSRRAHILIRLLTFVLLQFLHFKSLFVCICN